MSHKLVKLFASTFLSLVVVSASFFPASAAPPSNDNFADAEVITTLPFSASIDLTEAATEPGEPQPCYWSANTVWYSFTPEQNMLVQIGAQGAIDGILVSVFSSNWPGISGLMFLGCNNYTSTFNLTFEANKTYYFQIGGLFGSAGTGQVNLTQILPPANDDFENAKQVQLPLPFDDTLTTLGATVQTGEPTPTCSWYGIQYSVWYAFTPETSGAFSANLPVIGFNPVMAVYTGDSLGNLQEITCGHGDFLTIQTIPSTTYYFQIGNMTTWELGGPMQFHLDVPPPPNAAIEYYPWDPSIYDPIQFMNFSNDPAGIGFQTYEWDFGDGSTSSESSISHQYNADGDYLVTLKVTTMDGRTASTTTSVKVRTHDVSITKVLAPKSAAAWQTREIYVSVKNTHYTELVKLEVYKSVPGGMVSIDTLTQTVPVSASNRLTTFSFRYTFTDQDAQVGKVSFRVEAVLLEARDALPMDNTAISSPTRVSR